MECKSNLDYLGGDYIGSNARAEHKVKLTIMSAEGIYSLPYAERENLFLSQAFIKEAKLIIYQISKPIRAKILNS